MRIATVLLPISGPFFRLYLSSCSHRHPVFLFCFVCLFIVCFLITDTQPVDLTKNENPKRINAHTEVTRQLHNHALNLHPKLTTLTY